MPESISYSITRTQPAFAELSAQVEQLLEERQIPAKVTFAVQLVLDELVSNILKYGSGAPSESKVSVSLTFDDHGVSVEVDSEGNRFDPCDRPPPIMDADVEELPMGGLGIHLLRELMDDCRYTYEDGNNRMIMRKEFALDGEK